MDKSKTPRAPSGFKRFKWCIERSEFGKASSIKKGLYDGSTESSSFSFGRGKTKSSWELKLREDDSYGSYGLYLIPLCKERSRVDIKFRLGVIMKDGTEEHVKHGQIISGTDACAFGYPEFLCGVNFYYEDDEYITDDDDGDVGVLTIFCDHEIVRKSRLDFSRMFHSGKITDFTLVVGEEEFKVHRAVLASRSSVFEAMFEKEMENGRVEFNDLDVVGMKGLLEFIYFGEVNDLEEIAVKVLPAAEKYGVDELKTLCEKAICNKFRVMTDLHSAEYLGTEALEFIKKNSEEVADEEKFYELIKTNPKVFEEIVKSLAERVESKSNEGESDDESEEDESEPEGDESEEPEEKKIKLN